MGFDDANYQEPPDKEEYEAYEKEEKRKLSECCCSEGDFRFCHGEKGKLLLQVDEMKKVIRDAHLSGYSRGLGPCVCKWCVETTKPEKPFDESGTTSDCSKCGWSGEEETAEGFQTWSRSLHWKDGKAFCSQCA